MAARSARAVLKLLWVVAKSFIAFLLFLIFLFVGSLLVMVIADAVGLGDYKVWVMFVVFSVFMGVMCVRRVRNSQEHVFVAGPGTEVHNSRLRSTVKEELNRLRRKKPYPHP